MTAPPTPNVLFAPWSDQRVASLAAEQSSGDMHPYTCGHHSDTALIPTRDGWRCARQGCDYEQDWCADEYDPHKAEFTPTDTEPAYVVASREARHAAAELFDVIVETLRIPQLVDWMTRKLDRRRHRRTP